MPCQLPAKPKIHSFFDVIFMEDHSCQLRAGDDTILILRGTTVSEVLPHLVPYLDGTRTLSELAQECKHVGTEEEIVAIIDRLNGEGVIEDAALAPASALTPKDRQDYLSQLLFFSHFAGDMYGYQAKLKGCHVAVIGLDAIGTAVLVALASSGVGHITGVDNKLSPCLSTTKSDPRTEIGTSGVPSYVAQTNPTVCFTRVNANLHAIDDIMEVATGKDVIVVALDKPWPAVHEVVNKVCLENQIPWITCGSLRRMAGTVGPFFVPRETCCYTCYDLRMKANLDAYHEYVAYEKYLKKEGSSPADYGYLAAFATIIGHVIAVEVIKHLTQFVVPPTYGALFCFNLLSWKTEIHEVSKLPRCPSCGSAARMPPTALWSR